MLCSLLALMLWLRIVASPPFERSMRRSLFWFRAVRLRFTSRTCREHRDIHRPQLAWLVSERSLHHERLDPLASWPDAPCPSSSLYHKRLDPLASWPTPSPSLSLFRFFISAGESLVFVVFFCGMAVLCFVMFVHEDLCEVFGLLSLASTEIWKSTEIDFGFRWKSWKRRLNRDDSGTKRQRTNARTPESFPFILLDTLHYVAS